MINLPVLEGLFGKGNFHLDLAVTLRGGVLLHKCLFIIKLICNRMTVCGQGQGST